MPNLKFNFGPVREATAELVSYIKSQKQNPAQFIQLPFDEKSAAAIKSAAAKYAAGTSGVVVVGIGGSNLGAMAIWRALRPKLEIGFAETFDAERLSRILKHVGNDTVITIVSKSGTTSETIANAVVILDQLKDTSRVVAITDEGSVLWNWAKNNNIGALAVPKEVGGRYSVFSAVGLFPLAAAGVDIDKLLAGARGITVACLDPNTAKNPAAQSALAIYENWRSGKTIHDTFIFEPDLEALGKWYRQLTGESVGKDGAGVTPTVSIGTTDLHTVGQLYLDGPKDKFTTFIGVKNHRADFTVPKKSSLAALVPDIGGKKFGAVFSAVLEGVKAAYAKKNLPFASADLPEISEETLGEFLQWKMLEMIYLAKLMKVNAFDNPAVELYKEETRKTLIKL